ncbi:hypothetical protein ASE99_00680 [Serratia sp. Leaf51]|nr:hypothetical protein ASE99_00680 [Serratia sp. Leaf51]
MLKIHANVINMRYFIGLRANESRLKNHIWLITNKKSRHLKIRNRDFYYLAQIKLSLKSFYLT